MSASQFWFSPLKPVERQESLSKKLKYYLSATPCKRGHISHRLMSGGCMACMFVKRNTPEYRQSAREFTRNWNKENKEKARELARNWRSRNKERLKEVKDKWRENNKDKVRISLANWYLRNKDKVNRRNRDWTQRNVARHNARCSRYRCSKINRTPPWLSDFHKAMINVFYRKAKHRTESTLVQHVVDHIVPLQGKNVSGLHVPWNLQILTQTENARKINRFDDE